jgi:hypothetical protein
MDLNTVVTGSVILTFFLQKFFLKLDSPFMDFYFDGKSISFPQVKRLKIYNNKFRGIACFVGAIVLYNSVR